MRGNHLLYYLQQHTLISPIASLNPPFLKPRTSNLKELFLTSNRNGKQMVFSPSCFVKLYSNN